MAIRLKDVLNLPDSIGNELEYRSQLKALALATKIVNKVTGDSIPQNPYLYNPYLSESEPINSEKSKNLATSKDDAFPGKWDKNSKQSWGSNNW